MDAVQSNERAHCFTGVTMWSGYHGDDKKWWRTTSQDGGIGRHTVPSHTTKRRTTTNLKTKTTRTDRNQTVWKSDNQRVKEETFVQTGRRGGDWKPGQRGRLARQRMED